MAKARILAVDDQLYFRTFIEGILSDEGYDVRTAAGGEEAVVALEQERFDVVISDLVMPVMDGSELVQRIKEMVPDQEIIVVTGVGDVKTAVNAMKLGATDYLLKPIDRDALTRSLVSILQRKRLRDEHGRLMEENLEYMGVLSLYQRAVGLIGTTGMEPLAERLIEGLCFETNSQGGVVWVVDPENSDRLRLTTARGMVHVKEEQENLFLMTLPVEFKPLIDGDVRGSYIAPLLRDGAEEAWSQGLFIPLRHSGNLLGVARLTDKLERQDFTDADRAAVDKFAEIGVLALQNALRFLNLGTKSLRDPVTGAYSVDYFHDVVQNEIRKAKRFSRSLSVVKVELDASAPLWKTMNFESVRDWLAGFVQQLGRSLRTTDLIAAEDQFGYRVMLPETDALGATVLKRRIRDAVRDSEEMSLLKPEERPDVAISTATFPSDASQAEHLERVLENRLREDQENPLRKPAFEAGVFSDYVQALQVRSSKIPGSFFEQMMGLLLEEVGRRPQDRGLLFIAPHRELSIANRERLEKLEGFGSRTEVVLMTDAKTEVPAGAEVTRVPAARSGTEAPFLIFLGEGPAYACLGSTDPLKGNSEAFHTGERAVVEELAFQLKHALGISLGV